MAEKLLSDDKKEKEEDLYKVKKVPYKKDDMETVKSSTKENDFVVITEDFLVSGMQSGIGCNNDQLRLLGVEIPAKKGWKQSLIGKRISKETADKFIALKGIHKKADRKKVLENEA